MRRTITLYRLDTGEFGSTITAPAERIEGLLRDGYGYKDGEHDPLTRRVDIATGEVVDYDSPQRAEIERQRVEDEARLNIYKAEVASARAIREALLELLPADSPARARLQETEDAIAAERPRVTKRS